MLHSSSSLLFTLCFVSDALLWRGGTPLNAQFSASELNSKMHEYRNKDSADTHLEEILQILVEATISQQERLDRMETSQKMLQNKVSSINADVQNMKYLTYEQMALYYRDSDRNVMKSPPSQPNRGFTAWGDSFKPGGARVATDIQSINDTLVGLSLQVETLDIHLEEVEALVYDIKRSTTDDFSSIINNLIPVLQERAYKTSQTTWADPKPSFTPNKLGGIRHQQQYNITSSNSISTTLPTTPGIRYVSTDNLDTVNGPTSTIKPTITTHELHVMPRDREKYVDTNISDKPPSPTTGDVDKTISEPEHKILMNRTTLAEMYNYPECDKKPQSVAEVTKVKTIVGGRNKIVGAWLRDGYAKSSSIWVLQGFRKLVNLTEYASLKDLLANNARKNISLGGQCGGTGHIIYNRILYCNRFKSNRLYSQNLDTGEIQTRRLPGVDVRGKYGFSIGGFNDVDLITDSHGIWVVYTNRNASGNIRIAKLNPSTLATEFEDVTTVSMTSVMNTFMICGELYALRRSNEKPTIAVRIWSIHEAVDHNQQKSIILESISEMVFSADFDPTTKRLYSWNMETFGESTLKWYQFSYK